MHTTCVPGVSWRLVELIGQPGTEVSDAFEPAYWFWESNLGPWDEQKIVLTHEQFF